MEQLKYPIDLDNAKIVKDLILNTKSGIYATTSNDGENVIVQIIKGECADITFHQKNGWVRVDEYGANGFKISESFTKGKWR